jgi:hypothetical protein
MDGVISVPGRSITLGTFVSYAREREPGDIERFEKLDAGLRVRDLRPAVKVVAQKTEFAIGERKHDIDFDVHVV